VTTASDRTREMLAASAKDGRTGGRTLERMPISAVVITRDEERNLPYCLASLRDWCDELIVVDMHSTDRTREIATQLADVVIDHPVVEGFDVARLAGVEAARNELIFVLDADEIVHPGLAEWLSAQIRSGRPIEVIAVPRVNIMLGRWLRNSDWWPGYLPRLFRRESMNVSDRLHRGLKRKEGTKRIEAPADPQHAIWHFTHQTLDTYTDKANRYTTIEANQAVEDGARPVSPRRILIPVVQEFWNRYVVYAGFRDGTAGLAMAIGRAYYRFLSQAKIRDVVEGKARAARLEALRRQLLDGYASSGSMIASGGARAASEAGNPPEHTGD
jgi:glycosyltransferase involved in cell wall biosynthesis